MLNGSRATGVQKGYRFNFGLCKDAKNGSAGAGLNLKKIKDDKAQTVGKWENNAKFIGNGKWHDVHRTVVFVCMREPRRIGGHNFTKRHAPGAIGTVTVSNMPSLLSQIPLLFPINS